MDDIDLGAIDLSDRSEVVGRAENFPHAGNRPHGLAFDGRYLWHGDSNLAAFFKYDIESGSIVEKIQLAIQIPSRTG